MHRSINVSTTRANLARALPVAHLFTRYLKNIFRMIENSAVLCVFNSASLCVKKPFNMETRKFCAATRRRKNTNINLPFIKTVLLCLISLSPVASVPAQTVPDDDDVISFRTDLVTVPVTVTDRHHRFINTLTQSDFVLTNDDQPVSLASFSIGASRLALTFLLDTSGSTREIIARGRDAALALTRRFNQASRVSVLGFATQTRLIVPFTTDLTLAQNAFTLSTLDAQRDARTAIFDAANASVNLYSNLTNTAGERRIIILISDGLDTASTTPASLVINRANALGVSLYVIHIPLYAPRDGRLRPRPFARGFRDLAERTGGKFFQLGDTRTALDSRTTPDMTPIFDAIAADLLGQYVLAFYPPSDSRTGAPHRLAVRLTTPGANKLRVRLLRPSYTLPRTPPAPSSTP